MRLICLLLALALSGCLTNGKRGNEASPAIYDLGGVPVKNGVLSALTVTAIEVRAPLWLDTMGIDFRLLYSEPMRLREYSLARWAGPPSQLIQQRLAQQLALAPAGQATARCLLRLELSEFAQWFDSPEHSRGVLQGRILLLDKARVKIVDREISITHSAGSPDSRGGVKALLATVDQLATDLLAWEKSLAGIKAASACGF